MEKRDTPFTKKLQILSNIVIVQSNSNIGFVQVPVSYKKSEHFYKKRHDIGVKMEKRLHSIANEIK